MQFQDGEQKDSFYVTTLLIWMLYNKFDIFDEVIQHFEEKEEYMVCAGIHLALQKVEDLMHDRFEQATALDEDEDFRTYSYQEYEDVSKKVLKDVIIEMYEKQVDKFKEGN